jgi:DNA-binding MarR family transcriptional regulator
MSDSSSEDRDTTEATLTPGGQMAIFWRILHLLTARYGNHPMGQLLVALTMVFLNERGMPPTLTDLCEATGLPKASVSRYVSWQLSEGLVKETIDPEDRRRRFLVQTRKGKSEWRWQTTQLEKLFSEVGELDTKLREEGDQRDAADILELMKELTRNAPRRIR